MTVIAGHLGSWLLSMSLMWLTGPRCFPESGWVLKYNSHNAQRPPVGSGHGANGQGRLITDNLLARRPLPMFSRFPVPALPPVYSGWEGSFTDGMGMENS